MEFFKNLFLRGKENLSRDQTFGYTFLCGGLAGLNAITITFPLDVARTRLSINTPNSKLKETGLIKTLLFLIRNEGIKGLYKGYSFSFIVIKKIRPLKFYETERMILFDKINVTFFIIYNLFY